MSFQQFLETHPEVAEISDAEEQYLAYEEYCADVASASEMYF